MTAPLTTNLRVEMLLLTRRIRELAVQTTGRLERYSHHEICVLIADKYDLFDENSRFPLWVSKVVEGEMADVLRERP